ncbi:TetR family transcriptional regulator [uncultured Jatrophihabitans sp.]|uniref:TetR family transcriptional regulator n=1 Tax=uncultured Jatrophihabitans sp. TaxID=1610747 RepID=UPI0035CA35C8
MTATPDLPAAGTPYVQAARTLLRDTVLDAVDRLVRERGWSATTMAHVATAAGVSRQTLYNEFGGRAALVETYVAREIGVLVDQVAATVREHADDAHAALRSAFAMFLQLASDEPVIRLLAGDGDSGEPYRLVTTLGRTLAGDTVARLVPEVWPQVGEQDARLLSDSLVRLAISHALVPERDPQRVADDVGRMFARFVDELLGT